MTCSKSNIDIVNDKIKKFEEFKKDKESYFSFLSLDKNHFYEEFPEFDPWLYTLLTVDLTARLEELNKGKINEEKHKSIF